MTPLAGAAPDRHVAPLVALLLLGLTSPVSAADVRPLCANRPGKATPPCILDAGHVQFELGAVDASLDRGVESYAIANLVARYGRMFLAGANARPPPLSDLQKGRAIRPLRRDHYVPCSWHVRCYPKTTS